MKYLIQMGEVTIKFSGLDKMGEEFQKIFQLMFYFKAKELVKGDTRFCIEG